MADTKRYRIDFKGSSYEIAVTPIEDTLSGGNPFNEEPLPEETPVEIPENNIEEQPEETPVGEDMNLDDSTEEIVEEDSENEENTP